MGNWRKLLLALFVLGAGALSAWAQPPLPFPPETPPDYPPPGYAPPGFQPPGYLQPGYPPPGYPGNGYPNVMPNYPPVPWGAPIPGAEDPRKILEKLDKQNKSPNPLIIKAEGPSAFNEEEQCVKDQGCFANIGGMALTRTTLNGGGVVFTEPPSARPGTSTYPNSPQPVALDFNDVGLNMNWGVRAAIGYRYDNAAVELSGYYIFGSNSTASVSDRDSLYLPFARYPPPLGISGGGNNANVWLRVDQASILDNTSLANLEANYRVVVGPGAEIMFGLRFLRLNETLGITSNQDGLTVYPPDPRFVDTYQVGTQSNIIGPQIGFEVENRVLDWLALGVTGKALGGVNFYSVDIDVYRGDGFTALNNRRTSTTVSGAVELGAYFDFLPFERVRFRAGYEVLWLLNVPDAVNEVSYNISQNLFGSRDDHGNILFAGPFFEFSFAF